MVQTVTNITKAYIGIGILASPYGFSLVGYLLASAVIMLNGALNHYSIILQIKTKE